MNTSSTETSDNMLLRQLALSISLEDIS